MRRKSEVRSPKSEATEKTRARLLRLLQSVPVLGLLLVLMALVVTGCGREISSRLQGYIEGEFVYVAAPNAGTLQRVAVQRGQVVKAEDELFALDPMPEQTAVDEAKRKCEQARAALEDARKGKRPSEIDALEAMRNEAQLALDLAEKELKRVEELFRSAGATTEQEVDRARSIRDQAKQRLSQLDAELETARLGARADQVAAAEANLEATRAALAKAEWSLAQKRQRAPVEGVVFDTLYREGEWVPAGRPVVALLPPVNVKLRVFVPQATVGSLKVGDTVHVWVDGIAETLSAKVRFVSPRAEFTPPVIYSRENRQKFVFLVEAVFEPEVAARLHPGQPVDVALAGN